jgi:hypothetical protein
MNGFGNTYRTTSNENDYCALCHCIIPSGEEYMFVENEWLGSILKRKYHPRCYDMMIMYQPPITADNSAVWDNSVLTEIFLKVCCSCDNRLDCKILKTDPCKIATCPIVYKRSHFDE